MRMKLAALVLAAVSLAASARGADTFWLDVVAYPALPGAVRHLQVIHSLGSDAGEPDLLGRIQHATELMPADAQALAAALVAWSGGTEPPNATLWARQQGGYFLEFTSRPGVDRHVVVSSTAMSTTPGKGCRGCYGVVAFARQQMPLSSDEVLDLTAKLQDWIGGWNPDDAVVWTKLLN